ncbi:MAG TPA: hypothetical protein VHN14_31900 [Kofleriaceae bacterium]|nr:hypothetical protein [Kofleriaceae bacterium]
MLLSHAASAKPKVALPQIEGDASGDIHDAVVEALEGGRELSLISGKEVNRAVDKLGDLADLTEKDFKKLATELEADAIVLGKFDKVGSSKTLRFRLFVHKKMAKGFTVSFKDAKSEKFRTLLHDKMLDKIGVAAGGDGDDEKPAKKKARSGEDDEDPLAAKADKADKPDNRDKKARKAKAEDEDETRPKKAKTDKGSQDEDETRPKKAKADEEDAKPASDDAATSARRANPDDEATPRRAKKKIAASDSEDVEGGIATTVEVPHAANRVAVRLDAGVSVLQRSFKFNSRVFNNQPKSTSLSPVPGARFEAEIYPLAFSNPSGAAAGLGAGVEYDKTLSLNLRSTDETTVAVPVKQSHYSLGARYRLAFGKTATSPTLTFGAGYGRRLFSTDRSKLTMDVAKAGIARDTPETEYTVLDPGLMFRLPVTRMVALSLGSRGLLITNAGPIQRLTSYGRAKVYGIQALASVDVVLGNHFALRFAGEFVQIGFQFTGAGALSNNLDGDPTTQDVGGLADRSIGGSATLAILY